MNISSVWECVGNLLMWLTLVQDLLSLLFLYLTISYTSYFIPIYYAHHFVYTDVFLAWHIWNSVQLMQQHFTLSGVTCKTNAQADIVLLVDGSWSIGRLNFKTIRAFISQMVGVFDIGPERVQVGASTQMFVTNNSKRGLLTLCVTYMFWCFQVLLSTVEIQRLNGT